MNILVNPLEEFGDLELDQILTAFDRSDFHEAEHLAANLARRLYEPREAQTLELMARGYGAWDRFDFSNARASLLEAREHLERFADRGGWRWRDTAREGLARNIEALDGLADVPRRPARFEQGLPLLCWYVSAARRLLSVEKHSVALLLTYATVERFACLCLWVDYRLEDKTPDYSLIDAKLDRERYDELGREAWKKKYQPRELEGKLMFATGLQLLASLNPNRIEVSDLKAFVSHAELRNKCEFEHGFLPQPPERKRVKAFLDKATAVIARATPDPDGFEQLLTGYAFPRLSAQS